MEVPLPGAGVSAAAAAHREEGEEGVLEAKEREEAMAAATHPAVRGRTDASGHGRRSHPTVRGRTDAFGHGRRPWRQQRIRAWGRAPPPEESPPAPVVASGGAPVHGLLEKKKKRKKEKWWAVASSFHGGE
jgi:hypothetical protein